ncbi:MAG: capsular biosynthesis protein [Campylobacterota bacterium]|nr:capsular biosynthesis protein [Campylobacterota bacterium]
MNSFGSLKGRKILFLQGPMGLFFKRLDTNFRKKGALTYRIGLNMGDQFFSHKDNYTPFRGRAEEWSVFIKDFLELNKIDSVFLFGDCRFYQSILVEIAKTLNIEVFVFEEGYLRPHYITLEQYGVNGFSQISRDPEFYLSLPGQFICEPEHARNSKVKMVISATLYYALSNLFSYKYPHYMHHRDFSAIKEAFYGIRGLLRKFLYAWREKGYLAEVTGRLSKQYYFVPLQTHNDFQILQHSTYHSIEKFIIEVLESFESHAPKGTYLIFKHHPVDRGRKNYRSFIHEQAEILGIEERIIILYDVFLPELLKHARATVTINSTVGLTSISYGIPTLTLGEAIYDMEGLSNKDKSLNLFWNAYQEPNPDLYQKFKQFLIHNTQLNGSFYGRIPKEL